MKHHLPKQLQHGSIENCMEQKYHFEGTYQRKGSTFTNEDGTQIAVATRKNFTPSKPKEFVIYRTPHEPRGLFWSSIYPQPDGTYWAEYGKKEYRLTFTNEGLLIEAV